MLTVVIVMFFVYHLLAHFVFNPQMHMFCKKNYLSLIYINIIINNYKYQYYQNKLIKATNTVQKHNHIISLFKRHNVE